jgi:hypothetical protein
MGPKGGGEAPFGRPLFPKPKKEADLLFPSKPLVFDWNRGGRAGSLKNRI